MRFASSSYAAFGLIAALALPSSRVNAEEKQDYPTPASPPTGMTVRGVPGWIFVRSEKFDVTHTSTCESHFEGQPLDYKDRGVSELQLRLKLDDDPDVAKTRARAVSVAGFIKNTGGTRWDYALDKDGFKETRGDKVLRELRRDGSADERARVARAADTPLMELTWDADGNSRSALTADGLLEPLAETLALDRQLELLLPPIPGSLYEGATFHQTAPAPSPVPLVGVTPVKFTYHVDKADSGKTVEISFSGENSEQLASGFQWGGIPIPQAGVKIAIHGKITRDVRTQALVAAELEYDLQFSSAKVDFASHLKARDEWKRKD